MVDAEADTADTDTVADEDTPVDAMIGIVKGSYSGSYSSLRVPIGTCAHADASGRKGEPGVA